jgi:hypothetical protein
LIPFAHNRTLIFGSTLLKHGRHFDYWKQPLNIRMREQVATGCSMLHYIR